MTAYKLLWAFSNTHAMSSPMCAARQEHGTHPFRLMTKNVFTFLSTMGWSGNQKQTYFCTQHDRDTVYSRCRASTYFRAQNITRSYKTWHHAVCSSNPVVRNCVRPWQAAATWFWRELLLHVLTSHWSWTQEGSLSACLEISREYTGKTRQPLFLFLHAQIHQGTLRVHEIQQLAGH